MNRADPSIGAVASHQDPVADTTAERRPASPVRLTLAAGLGNEIDGAWWPRTGLISRELPELISILEVRLGQVIDINVNWSALQNQPNLDWGLWRGANPHVMTVVGREEQAKLLVVPYRTGTALAVMVLRLAAALPIQLAHRDSRSFQTAECVVRAARGERMFEVRRSGITRGPQR